MSITSATTSDVTCLPHTPRYNVLGKEPNVK
jgi:hypothetical protein